MKTLKTFVLLVLCVGFLFSTTSCAVFITPDNGRYSTEKHDNGKHSGWFKNPKNPHNPHHGNDNNKHEK